MNQTPSFFQRLATAARAVFMPGFVGGTGSAEAAVLPQGTTPPQRGLAQLIGGYASMPWLRAVAERIGRSVASCEWQLYFPQTERGRAEMRALRRDAPQRERRAWFQRLASAGDIREIESHPFLDAWDRPNPALNGFNSRLLTTLYLDLGGDGAWLLERNLAGMPIGWWPIPPTWVLSFPTAVEPGYRVNLPGWTGTIPAEEVVSFVNVNPADPYGRGSGIARALADELETDEATAKHLKGFFYNRARPDLLIYGKSMADLDSKQKRQIELDWRSKVGGFWNAWKPYFMRLAEVNVKELSQTLESMQMTDLRAHQRDTILHVFGAPPEVFGILENSNRSTIAAADFLFQKHLVVPRLELLRQTVQETLLPQYDERLVFEYVSPVEEDEEFYLKVAQAAPAVRNVDEWRELQGLGPHPDPQSGSAHLVSFSTESRADLRPAEKAMPSQPPPPPPSDSAPEDDDPEDPEPADGDAPVEEPDEGDEAIAAKGFQSRAISAVVRGYSARDLIALVNDIASKIAPEVVAILLGAFRAGREAIDPKNLANLLSSGQIAQVLAAIPFALLDEGLRGAASALRKALTRAAEITATILSDQTGGEVSFDPEHRDVTGWLAHAVALFASAMILTSQKAVAETVEDYATGTLTAPADVIAELIREQAVLDAPRGRQLRTLLDQMVTEGIPGDQMTASLGRAAEALREARATGAGTDQAFAAATRGRYEMWRQAIASGAVPVTAERTWVTAGDENVCPICIPMDGQTVKVTEQYYSPFNGEHYLSPGPPPDGPHNGDRCGEFLVF